MNVIIKFNQCVALTLLSSLTSVAYAHPGHLANQTLHGLLHSEHIFVLALAAAVSLAVYASRRK